MTAAAKTDQQGIHAQLVAPASTYQPSYRLAISDAVHYFSFPIDKITLLSSVENSKANDSDSASTPSFSKVFDHFLQILIQHFICPDHVQDTVQQSTMQYFSSFPG